MLFYAAIFFIAAFVASIIAFSGLTATVGVTSIATMFFIVFVVLGVCCLLFGRSPQRG